MNSSQGDDHAVNEDRLVELARQIENRIDGDVGSLELLLDSASSLNQVEFEELERAERVLGFLRQAKDDIHALNANAAPGGLQSLIDSANVTSLSTFAGANAAPKDGSNTTSPDRIGRFEIRGVLGQGGYARVFKAHDPDLDRLVALKVPLPRTLGDAAARKRFEREARAAAILSHPAIVPIFESGSTGPVSYIAFGYCPGKNLSEWIAGQGTDISFRQAASIVSKLAEATEHAHQRGIVHRDLKPANILVELNDDESNKADIANAVRITDFGLARQSNQDDTLTVEGAVVGTPAYMSPEQARGATDVGPATDTWALGMILYELITGTLPFSRNNHLSTLRAIETETLPEPRDIGKEIPRDLHSICLKCLQKDATSRYDSAYELSADLNRWLDGIPIQARPASAVEKVAAWSRRNPALAIVSLLAMASFVAGLAGTSWQWRKASASLRETKVAVANERTARVRAEKMAEFLGETYRSPDPRKDGRDVKVVDVLARAEKEIATNFADDPESRLMLLRRIARAYSGLGLVDQTVDLLNRTREQQIADGVPTDVEFIWLIQDLAMARSSKGDFKRALETIEEAIEYAEELEGDTNFLTARLSFKKGTFLQSLGKREQAIALYESAIEQLKTDTLAKPRELVAFNHQIASAILSMGQAEKAAELMRKTTEEMESLVGPDHPRTLILKNDLANALKKTSSEDQTTIRRELAESTERTMGAEHPQTLLAKHNLASTHLDTGNNDKAIALLTEVLSTSKAVFGTKSTYYFVPMKTLGVAYGQAGELELAQDCLERSYVHFQSELGPRHSRTKNCLVCLTGNYKEQRNWQALAEFWDEIEEHLRRVDGAESKGTVNSRAYGGYARILLGDLQTGISQFEEAINYITNTLPKEEATGHLSAMRLEYLESLLLARQYKLAEPLLTEFVESHDGDKETNRYGFMASRIYGSILCANLDRETRAADLISQLDPAVLKNARPSRHQSQFMQEMLKDLLDRAATNSDSPLAQQTDRIKAIIAAMQDIHE